MNNREINTIITNLLCAGYTEEEADFLVKSKRNINKEYWISKGYTEEDAIKKVSNIQKETKRILTESGRI